MFPSIHWGTSHCCHIVSSEQRSIKVDIIDWKKTRRVFLPSAISSERPFLWHYIPSTLQHPYSNAQVQLCLPPIVKRHRTAVWVRLSAAVWQQCKAPKMFKIQCTLKQIYFSLGVPSGHQTLGYYWKHCSCKGCYRRGIRFHFKTYLLMQSSFVWAFSSQRIMYVPAWI